MAWLAVLLLLLLLVAPAGRAAAGDFDAPAANGPVFESPPAEPATQPAASDDRPLWFWAVSLFVVSFAIGVVAVIGGVGGGVLYVPLVSGFMPFHVDYVRCAGLLVALAGSVAAGPRLLRKGLANLRLAMPMALIASASSIVGAVIGLALPAAAVQIAMGGLILGIAALMLLGRRLEYPKVPASDRLSLALGIYGIYHERSTGRSVPWRVHRTPAALGLFILVGIIGGMFGVGAGWANVPVLNFVLGAPLKLSAATSHFMISVTGSTAAWVYFNSGAALPLIVVPSMAGVMLGSLLGARLLTRTRPRGVRRMVVVLMLFAGARALLKGLGIWE